MKKVLALVIAVLMIAAMTNLALAAPTYIGEITIQVPDFDFEITLSDAASKYAPVVDGMYGASGTIVGKPGSTLTFSKDVSFGYMGLADSAIAKAGEPIGIDKVDGYYIYNGDSTKFILFATEANTAGQYNEAGLTNDITEIAVAAPETPAEPETPEVPEAPEVIPEVPQEPDPQPAEPPVLEAPPVVEEPPVVEAPPAPEAPAPAAPSDTTIAFDGIAKITVKGLQSKWYNFDLSAFGTPGFVYALYFDNGATVSFDAAVQLTSFDASFNMTTKDIAAGEVVSVADINGYSIAIGTTGNSVCFVLASNPGNYAGLVADQPLSALPAVVQGPVAPPTGDASNVILFAAVFAVAALGFVLVFPRRGKSK